MGGGKSGGGQTAAPAPISTTTAIGNALDAQQTTFDVTEEEQSTAVDKKKLGTRGLQIPLVSEASKPAESTASTTGVQI